MPDRTTIVLPPRLKQRATALARQRKVSFSEFVRQAVQKAVNETDQKPSSKAHRDRFWTDIPVFNGPGPTDIALNHDKYLYDEEP